MAQEVQGKIRTFLASAALAAHRLVKMNSTTQDSIAYPAATEGNLVIGALTEVHASSGDRVAVRMFNAGGTVRLQAAAAIACNAVVYCVGIIGKIDDAVSGAPIGIALKAATADLDIIEVMVFKQMPSAPTYGVGGVAAGYAIARGLDALDGSNATPITTGLATVVSSVCTLSGTAAPGLSTSTLSSANTNYATGALAVYAWKPTGAGDTTLIASTGTESFNWIAVGTL